MLWGESYLGELFVEGESIGKGANSIISYLHHYLDVYGVEEQHLQLQANNCVGQNKNNPMIQYLAWSCFTKRSSSCSIHFMLVGHTRFSPDQYFGMIKRKYRKTSVSSISQLSKVVSESTDTGMNKIQLAFDKESGCRSTLLWLEIFPLFTIQSYTFNYQVSSLQGLLW